MPTINWPTVSVISTGSADTGITVVTSSGGESLIRGVSSTTATLRGLTGVGSVTINSGSNSIEISGTVGSSGITALQSQGAGQSISKGDDGSTAYLRSITGAGNITINSGSTSIEISGSSFSLPSANLGDQFMYNGSGWTSGSYLSKYVVGPDATDRYDNLGDAIADVVTDGANASNINPAIIYVKPKLGTSNTYSVGNIVMPPNIIIQGLSYGALVGTPGARLEGTFTFASASSFNTFKDISLRTSSGNIINVTNTATVYLNSCDVRAESTAIPVNMNSAGCYVILDSNSTLQALGSGVVIQNTAGNFSSYGGTILQNGSSIISYNSNGSFSNAYASFNNCLIQGELHFTTNGAAEVFNCRQVLSSNSAYPVEFDNAGTAPNRGGVVYKNSSIQYSQGLTGPTGPWVNVLSGEASVYTGCVVLDETNLRTLNPYTDSVEMHLGQWDSEVSTSFLRRTFITDTDPTDRQILRFYDNGSSQDQAQWQDEEPVTTNNGTSITLADTAITRHLICSNSSNRSITLMNANVKPGAITIIDGAGTAANAPITVTGSGGQTINGDRTIIDNYGVATFISDGTSEWYRVNKGASSPGNDFNTVTFQTQSFSSGALGSVSLSTEGAYWLNAKISGMEASTPTSSGSCAFFLSALAQTDGGTTTFGSAGIQNDFTDLTINCDASFEISGSNLQVMVSGSGTYNWAATLEYQRA